MVVELAAEGTTIASSALADSYRVHYSVGGRVVISPCAPSPPMRPAASSWTCFRSQLLLALHRVKQ